MALSSNLGFPRIGAKRELKKALEDYWSGKLSEADLLATGHMLRINHWKLQQEAGLSHIPSNDFSFYDHVLDTSVMVGAVPSRYGWSGDRIDLSTYFAMARGAQSEAKDKAQSPVDLPAMEMTKWFDTNYHYIVPEFERGQRFSLASTKPVDAFLEAKAIGVITRPVLLGPLSFLLLGKMKGLMVSPLSLLESLLPVYETILQRLSAAGAEWVQLDEPHLVLDLPVEAKNACRLAYRRLRDAAPQIKLLLTPYFGGLGENLPLALSLPVDAVHLDLVRAPEQLDPALKTVPATMSLSLGLVDGRNIWKGNLHQAQSLLARAVSHLGSARLMVAPSCSLLHVPVDLTLETAMDRELVEWLAFARQKVDEIALLANLVNHPERKDLQEAMVANQAAFARRSTSPRIHNKAVKAREAALTEAMLHRTHPYPARRPIQEKALNLPLFPTTTIGSFPQTSEVRTARAEFKSGKRTQEAYDAFLRAETEKAVRIQEEIGIDVLVHGEFERNDMVEYFGEQLEGFVFTQNGWVQSYGSRCVKPPVIFGDVSRPKPMTVFWSSYAQSLTQKPMKGMLTGPVTILKWSFVRDDQPLSATCRQIALAIRDEVHDLEAAGIRVIQIDEPAIREGLPLRKCDWPDYLAWAVDAFKLSTSSVADATQIHTHMCYAEFNDIIEAIGNMDADVISMETSRSQMELLDVFIRYRYPNEIGPGVYDIHSPRVPSKEEMLSLLESALKVLVPQQVWVNPDCGLKTRQWPEVKAALRAMVEATKEIRKRA